MPTDIEILNKQLDKVYGHDLLKRPYFRVVLSSQETEKRIGHFEDYYGHIFLREYHGVRTAPKYTYLEPQYVLEKLVYMPVKELVESDNGHYECVWAFRDKKPVYEKCQQLIRQLLFGTKRVKSDYEALDRAQSNRYKQNIVSRLEEKRPILSALREYGEVSFPPLKRFEDKDAGSNNSLPISTENQGKEASLA